MTGDSLLPGKDALILLGAAGIVIPALQRLRISTTLGFLIVGLLLGPHVLGALTHHASWLSYLALSNPEAIAGLAEWGVVFLLFLIGLELSPERLLTMRHLVFGLGGLQVFVSTLAFSMLAYFWGHNSISAFVIGMALALSSTAIVIQLLSEERRLGSQAGRISFAILLLQDLAVIPMLFMVAALQPKSGGSLFQSLLWALAQAAIAIGLIVAVGRFALTPALRFVAASKSQELFVAAVLFIAAATAAVANAAGLSMGLGAFILGLMLAETEYRRAVEAIIEPFKGLLLGLFFMLVGLGLDLDLLLQNPSSLLAIAIAVIALKAAVIFAACLIFRLPRKSALEAALLLGPGGEFAFVILSTAVADGIVTTRDTAPVLVVVTLTMMAIPLFAKLGKSLRVTTASGPTSIMPQPPQSEEARVIVAGYGRVGTLVASMLEEQNIPYFAVDMDVANVTRAHRDGKPVFYGDATNPAFLAACGIDRAKALAITMDNPAKIDEILRTARNARPDLKIIARARDERHAIRLYEAGVTEAVPETIEASLQLAEALLVETGIAMGLAIAAVHERRDAYRKLLGRPNRRAEVAKARNKFKARMPTHK
jgi:Kef-type K+ transport system membrane component KefB/voltage-gated potassium channel Kch